MGDVAEVDLGTGGGTGNTTALYLLKDHTGDTGLTAAIYLSDLAASPGFLVVANDGTPSIDSSTYLTTASAAGTYLTIASAAGTYETTVHAAATYLTAATATATYLTIASATATYLTTANAAATYETIAAAAATYLTIATASATYLTIATAAITYAPIGAKYLCQTSNGSLTNEQDLSALATGFMRVTTGTGVVTSDTSTYLTTGTAASTYQPILSATAGSVLFSGGGSTVSQNNNNFYYDSTNRRLILAAAGAPSAGIGAPLEIAGAGSAFGDAIYFSGAATQISSAAGLSLRAASGLLSLSGTTGIQWSDFQANGTQIVGLGAFGPAGLTSLTPSKWLRVTSDGVNFVAIPGYATT